MAALIAGQTFGRETNIAVELIQVIFVTAH